MSVLLPDELQAIQEYVQNALREAEERVRQAAEEARQAAERARLSDELARQNAELANFAERKAKLVRLLVFKGAIDLLPDDDAPRDQWERLFPQYGV